MTPGPIEQDAAADVRDSAPGEHQAGSPDTKVQAVRDPVAGVLGAYLFSMTNDKTYRISAHLERVLCASGYFSPRTLRKALAGDRVQEMVRARIEAALRAHGWSICCRPERQACQTVCSDWAAASLAEDEHAPCTVNIADAVGDVHTIHMSHVSVRIGEQHRARLEAIVAAATQRSTMPISISLVLRRVIERGLAVVEHEFGLDGDGQAQDDEVVYG